LVLVAMTAVFVAIASRLVTIQGISANHYLRVGLQQRLSTVKLAGQRGAIFDRQGSEMAVSVPETTIWADPVLVSDPQQEAATLAPLLGVSDATLLSQLEGPGQFVYLAHTLPAAQAAKVVALKLPGIYGMQEPKRFNPAGSLAAPLLGTVGTDDTGLSGVEAEYNQQLSGRAGTLIQEVDPNGDPIPGGLRQYQPAVNGQDLVLTIDEPLQEQTEQALASAITAAKAKSGMAAVMDTQTGELLAVASLATAPTPTAPTPTAPGPTATEDPFTTVFEPGSMSKLVTISAALQDQVVIPADRFSVPDTLKVADSTFRDAESHPVENWTVTDILANSSNIGTMTIAGRLGAQRLDNALSGFGFGQPTGVGFPGESEGLVPSLDQWSGTSIATIAIGQGVAVTAIQMLAAYNTIADGGVYVAPKVVAATIDTNGQTHPTPPSAEHRVVSPQVAAEMNTMLGEVVRVGTGQSAAVKGYAVAGKTGTALEPLANARGYEAGVYTSSFAGFVPAGHPQLTAIVVIDQTPLFGATAAAPVFGTIAGDSLRDFRIPPSPSAAPVPGVPLATPQTAQAAGETIGPTVVSGSVSNRSPAPAPTGAATKPRATTTTSPTAAR
jgi:cell division protein FtsI (penicillin-binding protein 3)